MSVAIRTPIEVSRRAIERAPRISKREGLVNHKLNDNELSMRYDLSNLLVILYYLINSKSSTVFVVT